MVAQITMRTYGVKQGFLFVEDKSYPHFRDFSLSLTYKLKSCSIYPSYVDGGVVIIAMARSPMRNVRVSLLFNHTN